MILAVLLAVAGCDAPAKPPAAELYLRALDAIRDELKIDSPVRLHPLLIHVNPPGHSTDLPSASLATYDSSTVMGLLKIAPAEYRLCPTGGLASCTVRPGTVALTLSELQEVTESKMRLEVLVTDGRKRHDYLQHYRVVIRRTWRRWEATRIRRLDQR